MSRSKRNAAAEDYFRRAPGYSAEAIPSLRSTARGIYQKAPRTAMVLRLLADSLESSHKFALPDGGVLFDRTSDTMIESWRPPFPVTAWEWEWGGDSHIAISVEDRDVVTIFAVTRFGGAWTPLMFAVQMAIGATRGAPTEFAYGVGESGMGVAVLGEAGEEMIAGMSQEEAAANVAKVTSRQVAAVIQACAALACTNVTTEILRPNREARAARPASTLFDYHVLMIDPGKERNPSEPLGGTHASPRTHLRRGHIRRLAWGPRIWVNSCVVNPSAIGTVNKDYAVRAVSH